jgi:hypothetical protein
MILPLMCIRGNGERAPRASKFFNVLGFREEIRKQTHRAQFRRQRCAPMAVGVHNANCAIVLFPLSRVSIGSGRIVQ